MSCSSPGVSRERVSTDNGATYRNTGGDYVSIGTAGAETNASQVALNTGTPTVVTTWVTIEGINVNGAPKLIRQLTGTSYLFVQSLAPITALRFDNGGQTITAGTIYLLGRRAVP
jgi:hypothetical protein